MFWIPNDFNELVRKQFIQFILFILPLPGLKDTGVDELAWENTIDKQCTILGFALLSNG